MYWAPMDEKVWTANQSPKATLKRVGALEDDHMDPENHVGW